ncbi:MAG: MFS transporter [Desulfobacterales bacterium]|nr:MFS transporter [Desulfobacterales bacterium]
MKKLDKKVFATLFFSIFASITGVGIVVPLLPVYAHNLGAGGLYIGLIFGAFSLSRTFLMPFFGRLSDQKGRKPLIVAGLLAYAFVSLAFMLSEDIETLILIRFMQGIGSAMMMPVIQAYVGDITPEGSEGLTMGMFNISVFGGLSIGPLIGGFINDRFSLNTSFACMGFLSLVGFFLSVFFLPPTHCEQIVYREKYPITWKQLLNDGVISGLFLFRFAYTACISIIWSFMPLFADSKFSLSSSSIGVLVMLGVLISGLIHAPMGFLSDRWNRKMMIIAGGIIAGGAILSLGWAKDFWDLFWGNIFFGLGGGTAMPALMALAVLKGNQVKAMGSVMGLMFMAHSFGMLTGALLGGLMVDMFDIQQVFPLGAAIMAVGIFVFFARAYEKQETLKPSGFEK